MTQVIQEENSDAKSEELWQKYMKRKRKWWLVLAVLFVITFLLQYNILSFLGISSSWAALPGLLMLIIFAFIIMPCIPE